MTTGFTITGIGTYLPEKKLTNLDFEKIVDTNDEWIVQRTGIKQRFITGPEEFASDLGIKAVQNLIDTCGVTISDTDMIITTAFVPDHITPSISAFIAGHFGLSKAGSYDLHAACSGFAYGLITANSLILSGQAKKILLVTAETPSKVTDYKDRGTCILFGDGATAALIEGGTENKLFAGNYGTDGHLAGKVYCSLFSSSVCGVPVETEHFIWQDGKALYAYVVKNISLHIKELLDKAGLSVRDIDWFIPHSANLRMIDALRQRAGFDEAQMLTSIEDYGNTSSSSIPLAISLGLDSGHIKRGDKLLIYGFGGGITYAGAIFEW